jgi:hypothetical protein
MNDSVCVVIAVMQSTLNKFIGKKSSSVVISKAYQSMDMIWVYGFWKWDWPQKP